LKTRWKLNFEVIILETMLERNFILPQGTQRRPLKKDLSLLIYKHTRHQSAFICVNPRPTISRIPLCPLR
jgi:hypothetical protein